MTVAKTYEFLVRDDATRQAFRELWQQVDAIATANTFVSSTSVFSLVVNAQYNATTGVWTQPDTTIPSWAVEASASGDYVRVLRAPAGSSVITWVEQARWNSSGYLLPRMTAGSVLFLGTGGIVSQDNSHLFWNDAANRLGIGANDPDFDVQLTTESTSYPRGIAIYQHSGDFRPPLFIGRKSRGTHAARTAVQTNDILVEMAADAWHSGNDWGFGGAVLVAADENWTATAWGNRLEFWTGLNGNNAPQRRWVMDNVGHFWPSDDDAKDIGIVSPSSLRPRDIRLTRDLYVGATVRGPGTIAAAGFERLANAALIAWRNAGNTADLSLNVNSSDQYEWVNGAHRIASVNRFRFLQAMARVRQSADQSINDSTATDVTFDVEDFDTDTLHSTVSNTERLTAQIAGKYLVQAGVDWESNAVGNRKIEILKNGTTGYAMSWVSANLTDRTTQNVCALVDLAANDYVTIRVTQTSGGGLNALSSDDTFLSMVYVGE